MTRRHTLKSVFTSIKKNGFFSGEWKRGPTIVSNEEYKILLNREIRNILEKEIYSES